MKERIRRAKEIQDEINFKELFRSPARLFGYIYFYFLIVIVALGLYYIYNLPDITKNTIVPTVEDTLSKTTDLPLVMPVDIPPVDVFSLSTPSEELINKGREFYLINCASCHGERGEGDGPAGLVMNPKPRNLAIPDGWVNGRKISEIYKTLNEGILKNGMPSYNHVLPEELFAVTHFVRTLSPNPPQDSKEDLENLNLNYKLSEGIKSSGQIPTAKAIKLILDEEKSNIKLFEQVLSKLNSEKGNNPLLRFVTSNEKFATLVINFFGSNSIDENSFINVIKANPGKYGISTDLIKSKKETISDFYKFASNLLKEEKAQYVRS